jgi:hypothetical protein
MNKRNRGMWRNTGMLVLGSQFTKLLMSESPFLLSHPVITPMLYVIKKGCKQLLEMVLMGDSITWDIFHKSYISSGMNLALNNHHHHVLPISLDNYSIPSICKNEFSSSFSLLLCCMPQHHRKKIKISFSPSINSLFTC